MTDKKDENREETQIEDLEAFEEWEAGGDDESLAADERDEFSEADVSESDDPGFSDLAALQEGGAPATVPPEPLAPQTPAAEEPFSDALLDLAPDVPANLVAVIGKRTTSVGELMKLRIGNVIDLGRPPGETVDLVVNGRLIARGELVDIDGQLGVRILKMVK